MNFSSLIYYFVLWKRLLTINGNTEKMLSVVWHISSLCLENGVFTINQSAPNYLYSVLVRGETRTIKLEKTVDMCEELVVFILGI